MNDKGAGGVRIRFVHLICRKRSQSRICFLKGRSQRKLKLCVICIAVK